MQVHQPAATAPPQTLYQTLLSVNSVVGQSNFQASDRKAAKDRYSTIFMQNKVGDSIYDAIAAVSGSESVGGKLIAETSIPRDFILDKKKLSRNELLARMTVAGRQIFNKELPTQADLENGNPATLQPLPAGVTGEADFALRISELRLMLIDMGMPRMKAVWLNRFHQSLKSVEYKEVKSVEDFVLIIKTGKYDNDRRRDIDIANNRMMGNLSCFTEIERVVMKNAKLKYTDRLVDGSMCKTKRQHGSLKSMYVRLRQTHCCDQIRHGTLSTHLEALYKRLLTTPQTGIVEVRKVTVNSHGFNGYLGYALGHPALLEIAKLDQAITKKPVDLDMQLLEYLQAEVKAGTAKTTAELLQEWSKKPEQGVVVSVSSDQSSAVSPMTESSDVESESIVQDFSVDLEQFAAKKVTPSPQRAPKKAPITNTRTVSAKKAASATSNVQTTAPLRKDAPIRKEAPTKQIQKKIQRKRMTQGNIGAKDQKVTTGAKRMAGSATVPSTPNKKAKQKTPPPSPDFVMMANGRNAKICKHHKLREFIGFEKTWFTDARRGLEHHPTACSNVECKKQLVDTLKGKKGKKDRSPEQCIAGKVYACDNAVNHRDHVCVFAYCTPCFEAELLREEKTVKEGNKAPLKKSSRKRKAIERLQPGERRNENGDIVAA